MQIGTEMMLSPSSVTCQISKIINVNNQVVRYAKPGENVYLVVRGLDQEELVARGDILCGRSS